MGSDGRILIVDDEVNARAALAELLGDEGYAVETAADGFKALAKFDDFAPDVVVTDLKMPGLNGIELMHKVRERDPECVIVVMTAHGAIETAVEAMREGAADYIGKPVNVEELSLVLRRELERKRLKTITGFTDDALERLVRYHWPGNVRELENAIERAVVVARGSQIRAEELAPTILPTGAQPKWRSDGPRSFDV
jgi:DNA-binding NtrC family response regulator